MRQHGEFRGKAFPLRSLKIERSLDAVCTPRPNYEANNHEVAQGSMWLVHFQAKKQK